MIENYLRKRENLTMVFVLIDARHSPQKIDLEFLENLKLWQVPFCLVFTKSDKENQRVVSKNVKDFLEAMKKTWQFLPQNFVTSAVKKTGNYLKTAAQNLLGDKKNQTGWENYNDRFQGDIDKINKMKVKQK